MEVGEQDWRQENRLMVLLLIQIKVENKAVRTGLERDRSFLKMKQQKKMVVVVDFLLLNVF